MKAEVLALPDGETLWQRFLDYDRRLTETLGRESRACGIQIVAWGKDDTVTGLSMRTLNLFDQLLLKP